MSTNQAQGSRWEKATEKQAIRRNLGKEAEARGLGKGIYLEYLKELGLILLSTMPKPDSNQTRASYPTIVVAYFSYDRPMDNVVPLLFLVLKLADVGQGAKTQILQRGRELGFIKEEGQLIFIDEVATNLHAEMAVVRYLHAKGMPKKHMGGLLEIYCVGKGVCLDCSGWLTKHGIPHAPFGGAPSPTGWKNPITDAIYKASGENLVYTKGLAMSVFNREFGGPYEKKS